MSRHSTLASINISSSDSSDGMRECEGSLGGALARRNQPAEASALTEAEAPVTAAPAKAPAAAATRKLWWNLFRICYISAVAVSCTVEDSSLAFVFERDASPRTAGALLASARDACANLDSERTCSAASAGAERSTSASAARAVAVGCTVEQGVATVNFDSFTSGSAPRLASVKGDLGLRPRERAVSGMRPRARAFSGSAPRLASVKGDSRMRRDLRYIPDAFSIGPGGGV
ncbi:hypothetical protein EMIHUDRAFT_256118 [Emiliania huxleyi CCMP1516]|uniref:Uncharacterized protein n=2 Tax=Emiliania huxleyi TaxID=2903 RepID=A0A0D3IZD9_EMIH1|nr:hypothetical protein EMIHUDRAFT_256118 [Emiliania huxleyi CCMP1516]EOD16624.1 hypothetical protein EMIHUDRAFT_256118 [Emiliania huxleyi CCMP1516]|eukprot:XP_005769053.1 hypothetical protein EMIHUDRAFT_256118 [Emiliania huxleyi CCMP1516]